MDTTITLNDAQFEEISAAAPLQAYLGKVLGVTLTFEEGNVVKVVASSKELVDKAAHSIYQALGMCKKPKLATAEPKPKPTKVKRSLFLIPKFDSTAKKSKISPKETPRNSPKRASEPKDKIPFSLEKALGLTESFSNVPTPRDTPRETPRPLLTPLEISTTASTAASNPSSPRNDFAPVQLRPVQNPANPSLATQSNLVSMSLPSKDAFFVFGENCVFIPRFENDYGVSVRFDQQKGIGILHVSSHEKRKVHEAMIDIHKMLLAAPSERKVFDWPVEFSLLPEEKIKEIERNSMTVIKLVGKSVDGKLQFAMIRGTTMDIRYAVSMIVACLGNHGILNEPELVNNFEFK
jgi:hypothetical protein